MIGQVGALVASGAGAVPATPAAAARADPVLLVETTTTLGCGVRHRDDPTLDFFGSLVSVVHGQTITEELDLGQAVCGTFVAVDGQPFGSSTTLGAEAGDGPVAAFTPVAQTGPTGDGSAADPFRITTRVAAGSTGVLVEQTDTWTALGEVVTTTIAVTAPTPAPRAVQVYRAADCQATTRVGFGRAGPGVAACVVAEQDGAFRDLARLVPGSGLVRLSSEGAVAAVDTGGFDRQGAEDFGQPPGFLDSLGFGHDIDASIMAGAPLVAACTRCDADAALDRTIGIGWTLTPGDGSTTTVTSELTVSTGAARASARLTAAADPSGVEAVTARFDAPAPASDGGRTLRFLRDGTEVCRAVTDADGRATCDVPLDLAPDPERAALDPAPIVDVLFDGDLGLRPAGALVELGPWPAPPGELPPACLPTGDMLSMAGSQDGVMVLTVEFEDASCPSVRYSLVAAAGPSMAYLPGDGTPSLRFVIPGLGPHGPAEQLVVTRFRRPDQVLARLPVLGVSPGKPRR